MTTQTLWHTVRLANSDWPGKFEDVEDAIRQRDNEQVTMAACAVARNGDLHVVARDLTSNLWHTIRMAIGQWPFPLGDVQEQTELHGPNVGGVLSTACTINQSGDLHVLALRSNNTLWHAMRVGKGWPRPFGNVQVQTSLHGPNISPILKMACATNQGGDLHILATNTSNKLWHTIRLADGSWPFPFGDVQGAIGQGNIGPILQLACTTNQSGALHILALDASNKLWHTIRVI